MTIPTIRLHNDAVAGPTMAAFVMVAALLTADPAVARDGAEPSSAGEASREQIQEQSRDQSRAQSRDQFQDGDQIRERDRQRDRLREGIDTAPGLREQDRQRMRSHLQSCLDAGLPPEYLVGMFPAAGERAFDPEAQLRLQERVVGVLAEGLPPEPLVAKIREGWVKQVPEARIEHVADLVEGQVRHAHRFMNQVHADGMTPPDEPRQQREQVRTMAQHMWGGLQEGDMERLREQARDRLRDGTCRTGDLVGACGAAVRMMESGAPRDHAVDVAGDALRRGWTRTEMAEMGAMFAAGRQHGGPVDRMLREMATCMNDGMGPGEMSRHMMQQGWLGPGGLDGHMGTMGGHHGGDPGYGGHHDQGTHGDGDHDHGGGRGGGSHDGSPAG